MWGKLWNILEFFGDMVLMHVLWLVSSLPVFTIGASTTALYYTAMKRVDRDRGTVFSNFKHSFKQNFKQSTIYWLLLLLVGVILVLDLYYSTSTFATKLGKVLFVVYVIAMITWWMVGLYIFPVQAKFENNLLGNFKNALFLSIRHLPFTLLLTLIALLPWVLAFLLPPFAGLLVTSGAGIVACLSSLIYVHIFRIYTHEGEDEEVDSFGTSDE